MLFVSCLLQTPYEKIMCSQYDDEVQLFIVKEGSNSLQHEYREPE